MVASHTAAAALEAAARRFNPLHCGAVVASDERTAWKTKRFSFQSPSLRGSGRFALRKALPVLEPERFNPLHCGAVVASPYGGRGPRRIRCVSIPFIAGQWSLHGGGGAARVSRRRVSIPFIAGQWSLPEAIMHPFATTMGVSIPFIAGQWSLLRSQAEQIRKGIKFQSPSLRGSGRFRG